MFNIFICEDENVQRKQLERAINNYIKIQGWDCQLTMSTCRPKDLLIYLQQNTITKGLFFLDINLGKTEMNGLELGKEIRRICPCADIVIITVHDEYMPLTFEYGIEAMAYISKENIYGSLDKVRQCIDKSYERLHISKNKCNKYFKVIVGSILRQIDLKNIIFFETSYNKNKVCLYYQNGFIEFRGSLKSIESFDTQLYRVHESFIINISHIQEIKYKERVLVMSDQTQIPISFRKLRVLKTLIVNKNDNFS